MNFVCKNLLLSLFEAWFDVYHIVHHQCHSRDSFLCVCDPIQSKQACTICFCPEHGRCCFFLPFFVCSKWSQGMPHFSKRTFVLTVWSKASGAAVGSTNSMTAVWSKASKTQTTSSSRTICRSKCWHLCIGQQVQLRMCFGNNLFSMQKFPNQNPKFQHLEATENVHHMNNTSHIRKPLHRMINTKTPWIKCCLFPR